MIRRGANLSRQAEWVREGEGGTRAQEGKKGLANRNKSLLLQPRAALPEVLTTLLSSFLVVDPDGRGRGRNFDTFRLQNI